MVAIKAELNRTAQSQNGIGKVAIAGQKEGGKVVAAGLLPVSNQMLDIVATRTRAMKTHPPMSVFAMLALMACAAAFHGPGTGCPAASNTIGFAVSASHGVCHRGHGIPAA